jgi:hypothetical protein
MKKCLPSVSTIVPWLLLGLTVLTLLAGPSARGQCSPPVILSSPHDQSARGDSKVTFTVQVSSAPECGPVIYEWYELVGVDGNLDPIPGGTNASVTITARQFPNDPDHNKFGCRIENAGGVVFIPNFTLTVIGGTYEAENMLVDNSSGDTVRTLTESAASGGFAKMVDSDAVGDFVTLRIPKLPAGTYSVRVRFKKHPSRGKVQTSIGKLDGTLGNIGPVIDLYSANPAYQEYTLGNWTPVSTSDKQIRFKITGKNSSSSGYSMCIDYVKLVLQ